MGERGPLRGGTCVVDGPGCLAPIPDDTSEKLVTVEQRCGTCGHYVCSACSVWRPSGWLCLLCEIEGESRG